MSKVGLIPTPGYTYALLIIFYPRPQLKCFGCKCIAVDNTDSQVMHYNTHLG